MRKISDAYKEFILVYGWAILLVLGALVALAHFGVLSPDNLLAKHIDGACCERWCQSIGNYHCSGYGKIQNTETIRCMHEDTSRQELNNRSVVIEDSIIYYILDVEKVCNGGVKT